MAQFGWAYVGAVSPPVQPPAPTSESTLSGVNFSNKTFGAFTDPDGLINTYQAVTTNATGSTSWSGTGLGPYTAVSSDGDAGTLSLNALDGDGDVVATAVHSYERNTPVPPEPPQPPSPTSESTLSGVNFSNKTFGAFTDPDSIIVSYSSVTTNATGSTSWSGSGLGPYSATSSDGDAGTLSLNAIDVDGDVVATAIHSYERGVADPPEPPQPPTPTSESTLSGVNFSNKTFGAFTDPDSVIVSYTAVTTNARGTTSWSGSGLGPYAATSSADDAGTLSLNAIDADGDVVATAVHSYGRASISGSSQPSLSVSGRADGEAYNVSAGARSLSITATSGSTLSTTVELASTGLAITVTGSTTTAPNWTAPAAISGGDAYQVKVEAIKDGLTGSVSFTERVAGTTSGASWTTLKDYDLTDLTTTSALSVGTHTLSFDSISDTIDVVFSKYSDSGGISATPTNGSGIVIDGGTDTTSAGTISMRPSDWLSSYTADDVQRYVYAITFVLTVDLTANPGNSGFYCGVNVGSNTTHNSGDSRHFDIRSAADSINETVKIRLNTTSTGTLTTQALRTARTVTAIVHFGEIVQLMDTDGATIPTPDVTQGTTYVAGSDAVGRNDDTRVYQNSSGIRAFFSCSQTGDITCSRVIVRRFE